MPTQPEQIAVCDLRITRWASQLRSDDLAQQEKARRRINYWLDQRLVLMREEDQCVSSQQSASVAS